MDLFPKGIDEALFQPAPPALEKIIADSRKIGFQLWCWPQVGALLRAMAATKPGGRLLEIGTGTGVGTCWLLDGMDKHARLITVEANPEVEAVARSHLGADPRLTILLEDGASVIRREQQNSFDLVFADGGVGKHSLLDETLSLLRPGGIYICDDVKPHPMWPPEHAARVPLFTEALLARTGFRRTYLDWSSGVVMLVKPGA